ncbi:methyltransferase family protein [Candidatus Chrysopegis kryptomonas]|uniref:Phospholipid methyltransferase n=1 Tax=Candidatus Chryseopegocella kryptomonas TaxID=1633643 RepID=A0A0P1NWE6_9BACT|nr:isoprenylcysteine carboxylmethyltransferase family protein [Candidatus Chrysopegis kryptomonas]CUT03543.1 Phospholipid methyltransferase [Candidatus Chrysopegis kryptomonas]
MTDLRQKIFSYRSYTPIPFLIVMILFAKPSLWSLAIGFIIALIGELIRIWGVGYAGGETRTTGPVGGSKLVTNGPYAYVRNPLYIGNMLIYLGFGIMSMALFPYFQILGLIYFFVQYYLIVTLEEEYLSGRFGDEYKLYFENVRRFIPRLRRYKFASNFKFDIKEALRSEKRTLQAFFGVTLLNILIFFFRNKF